MLIVKIYEMLTDSLIAHKKDMLKIVTAVNFFPLELLLAKLFAFMMQAWLLESIKCQVTHVQTCQLFRNKMRDLHT